jgi:ABC-type transporter Mla MlaB component
MSHKSSHLPQEIYHRIYWYAKRNVDPHVIAHTLKLPLKTVEHILERFSATERSETGPHAPAAHTHTFAKNAGHELTPASEEDFLDIFLFVKTRYTVMDISGMMTKGNMHKLTAELHKLRSSDLKAVAIRLADLRQLDEDGLAALIVFHDDFKKMGRYIAVLDPSLEAETFIAEHDPEKKLPLFGTETAFESHAFR